MDINVKHDSRLKSNVDKMISLIYRSWLVHSLRSIMPKKLKQKIYYLIIESMLPVLEDWLYLQKKNVLYLPPRTLRFRAHGSKDIEGFLTTGKIIVQNLNDALACRKSDIYSFENILDFGCGCSRVLRWFDKHPESCKFYGTDIDHAAISWNKKNIPFADFVVNDGLPPLPYPSEMFDLIYGISVLTHLNEEYQFQWLRELRRIGKPNAILILTIHGQYAQSISNLPSVAISQLYRSGFLFVKGTDWKGIFPDYYQNTFHTKAYVLEKWSKYFRIVDYIEKGLNNHQDLVILEKED